MTLTEDDVGKLRALIQRARDVETLDAWADERECSTPEVTRALGQFRIRVDGIAVYAKTRDAARHAAAEAIRKGEV